MVDKNQIEKLKSDRLKLLAMAVDMENEAQKYRDNVKRLEGAIEALEGEIRNGS